MEGAEQILTELNSLHSSFNNANPNLVNLEEILQPTIPQTMASAGGASGSSSAANKQVPMYPYMDQRMPPTANGAPWVTDDMPGTAKADVLASTSSAPMLNLGTGNSNGSMDMSLPSGNDGIGQSVSMPTSDYQNDGQVMRMHPVDVSEPMGSMVPPSKEVGPTKRHTMSNWTKAPRVLVVEDDAVS